MILLPNGQNNVSSDWVKYGAPSINEALQTNDGNTSYCSCNDANEYMIIEFAAPSVAEAGIDFGETVSVRYLSSGRADHRSAASLVGIAYETPSGNPSQINSYDPSPDSFESLNGVVREYSDGALGGTALTYSDLENLEIRCTKILTIPVVLTYLAMRIDFTEAVSADNATFFGTNF